MLDAVLTGDGLAAVADLAADAAGGPVAVVVPRLGVAVASADVSARGRLGAMELTSASGDLAADHCAALQLRSASGDADEI